jgi:hypothetical protein
MTTPRFDRTLDCVHCSAEVEIPLSTIGGEEDYWLYDGQELLCEACGGVNRVTCDVETSVEFEACEEPSCAACGLGGVPA